MSAEVLELICRECSDYFLRTKQFTFEPKTDAVENIKLDFLSNDHDDNCFSSLAAFATEHTDEQGSLLMSSGIFRSTSFQRLYAPSPTISKKTILQHSRSQMTKPSIISGINFGELF